MKNFWVIFACIVLFLSINGCSCYNHYKVYNVDDIAMNREVMLTDQFNKNPMRMTIESLTSFANPVSKNGGKIYDKNAHLNWYKIHYEGPQPVRTVTFNNQFGTQTWKVGFPVLLAVPTEKFEEGSEMSEKLDHYLAYRVMSDDSLNIKVELEDQFDKKLDRKETKFLIKPLYFCNPVQKNDEPIKRQKKENHLACYQFIPLEMNPPTMDLNIQDQFGQKSLNVKNSFMLCVPSTKQKVEIVKE